MNSTLLEMVQQILSSMDSDEVNDISDTTESYQVALLLKQVYYDIATDLGLPEHEGLIELTASGDDTKPTLMSIPSSVVSINWIKYDNKLTTDTYSNYKTVEYLPFPEFMELQAALVEQTSDVGEMTVTSNTESFPVMYWTDRFPQYYTTFDDTQLIFDAYNSDEDTTLAKAKTMCFGLTWPTFTLSNSFTPDLNPQHFSYYINRAKVRAFAELKQAAHQEAAAEARRQKIVTQFRGRKVGQNKGSYPRYGRK